MMSDLQIWYKDNDMVIELSDVTDNITGNAIDDATITATLKDKSGVEVPGITWPVTLSNISSGLYRATVDKAAVIAEATQYTLFVDLTTPGGGDAHWEINCGGAIRK